MAKQTARVGGVRVVFRTFDLNLGVFRRMGCSVHLKGGRRTTGDIHLVNTYYALVDGVTLDVATVEKERRGVKHCSLADFWVGLSATVDTGGDVSPGSAPQASVDGVRTAAMVVVNGESHRFTGET